MIHVNILNFYVPFSVMFLEKYQLYHRVKDTKAIDDNNFEIGSLKAIIDAETNSRKVFY